MGGDCRSWGRGGRNGDGRSMGRGRRRSWSYRSHARARERGEVVCCILFKEK